jgi:hypothetical protein
VKNKKLYDGVTSKSMHVTIHGAHIRLDTLPETRNLLGNRGGRGVLRGRWIKYTALYHLKVYLVRCVTW